MSSTKAGLELGKTSVEKEVDYAFAQREADVKYKRKELPILEDVDDLTSVIDDAIKEVEGLPDTDKTKDYKLSELKKLLWTVKKYYPMFSEMDIASSDLRYRKSSQQKFHFQVMEEAFRCLDVVGIPDKLGAYNGLRLYTSKPVGSLDGLNLDPQRDLVLEPFPTSKQLETANKLDSAAIGLLKYPTFYADLLGFSDVLSAWNEFIHPLMNPITNFRATPLYAQISREIDSVPDDGVEDWRVAIDVGDFPHTNPQTNVPLAIVPRQHWFPTRVKHLKASDIVALLPPTELEVLMLILGRALVGPSKGKPCGYDHKLKHNHRTAAILLGRPGTGKSELLDLIDETMTHFGFKVQCARSFCERFGLGELANAALVYKDDGSNEEIAKLLNSSTFKTFCSGGKVCAEKKHKEATYKRARAAIILASNHFNPNNAYGIDAGVQSRLRLLETIDATSRDRLLESLPPDHLWYGAQNLSPNALMKHLSQKLDVDRLVIFGWFLRLCCDKFYESIPNLPEIDKTLESKLQNRIPADLLYITVKALKFTLLLRGQDPDQRITPETLHRAIEGLAALLHDHRTGTALALLKQDWEDRGRQPEHLWSAIRELRFDGLQEAHKESCQWLSGGYFTASGKDSKVLENYIKLVFCNLVTWGSIKISPSPAQLASTWNAIPSSDLRMIVTKVKDNIPPDLFDVDEERLSWRWYKPTMRPSEIREARIAANKKYELNLKLYGGDT